MSSPDPAAPKASPEAPQSPQPELLGRATEVTIRISLIAVIVIGCFLILRPFLIPVVWGIIIATACYPAHCWLLRRLGGRDTLSAVVIAVAGVLLIVVPLVLSAGSLVESARWLAGGLSDGSLDIPPPPDSIADWPIIGKQAHGLWQLASQSLSAALEKVGPQLAPLAGGFLRGAAGLGLSLLQFLVAIAIGGALLARADSGSDTVRRVLARLVGGRGTEFAALAAATVRGVTQGILGVALIQAALISLGLFAIGIPHAALWATLCLLLAVIQLSPGLVLLPIVIYAFGHYDTVPAVLFAIWSTLCTLIDNVLKPILLSRGLSLPMPVVFMGAIGGFIASGFIGLFLGAVVLAVGYELFRAWLAGSDAEANTATQAGAA